MILSKLISFFTNGGLKAITSELGDAYQAKLNAANDSERVKADIDISQLKARQAVLIAEQGNRVTRWIRPAFALPFVIYNAKILIWDKTLKWGVTDDLPPEFWQLQMIVFGAFFLTRSLEKR